MKLTIKSVAKLVVMSGVTAIGLLTITQPSKAYNIYTAFDPNGNPSVNLLPNIPNSKVAENSFLSSLVGTGTETFESFTPGTGADLALVFPGAGTATLKGTGTIQSAPAGSTNGFGRYGVSPTNYWEVNAGSTGSFSIDFSNPVAAFGFYGIDIGDFAGTLSLTFDNGSVLTQGIPTAPQAQADGSVLYWGIITTPAEGEFTKVSFDTTIGTGDVFAFDNMTIGSREQVNQGVPGPLPILGVGMAFGYSRNLRKRIKNSKRSGMLSGMA